MRNKTTWRPCLEALEDRTLPTTFLVTNVNDSGKFSLRDRISHAHDGDTIKFSPTLYGKTIKLNSEIAINKGVDIEGPGASFLAISGNAASRIFHIFSTTSLVTIAGLTLNNGLAPRGGAILVDGASLTLKSDILFNNHATIDGGALAIFGEFTADMMVTITGCQFTTDSVQANSGGNASGGAVYVDGGFSAGLTFTIDSTNFSGNQIQGANGALLGQRGGDAYGGALYIGAGSASGMIVQLKHDTFNANKAFSGRGADGGVYFDVRHSGGHGGSAQGGDVWIDAGTASRPLFSFVADTFNGEVRAEGGGDGAAGFEGGTGGTAEGGAIYYGANHAAGPKLTVTSSNFHGSSAKADVGGVGGSGGRGGDGGSAFGGAVEADFAWSAGGSIEFTGDSFTANLALGGDGGSGGEGIVGGQGGFGGSGVGGAIRFQISGYASGTQLTISQSTISQNRAQSGNGGAGGIGTLLGGDGGYSGLATGGGMQLFSRFGGIGAGSTWTLDSDVINNNVVQMGNGGAGGSAVFGSGGNGGKSLDASGGGVSDQFDGDLHILHSTILLNSAKSGLGGAGGSGATGAGSDGASEQSFGGGVSVNAFIGTACATVDTQIFGNFADTFPDIYGVLGTC